MTHEAGITGIFARNDSADAIKAEESDSAGLYEVVDHLIMAPGSTIAFGSECAGVLAIPEGLAEVFLGPQNGNPTHGIFLRYNPNEAQVVQFSARGEENIAQVSQMLKGSGYERVENPSNPTHIVGIRRIPTVPVQPPTLNA